ncbi:16855_t:CDS:1, partial [Racocetra fulgida]
IDFYGNIGANNFIIRDESYYKSVLDDHIKFLEDFCIAANTFFHEEYTGIYIVNDENLLAKLKQKALEIKTKRNIIVTSDKNLSKDIYEYCLAEELLH